MGGLLQENQRDVLFFQAARNNHIKALQTNLATQKPLKVTRRVQGKDADEYVYCGLYEVVDEWPAPEPNERNERKSGSDTEAEADDPRFVMGGANERTYFKLLRLPGQPPLPLPPLRMAFKREKNGIKSIPERCFEATCQYYASHRLDGSTGPFERFSPVMPPAADVHGDRICDRCGIHGLPEVGLDMHECMSCWDPLDPLHPKAHVVSHESCIDRDELKWLLGNLDERHWRCKKCRQGNLRPKKGLVYEDNGAPPSRPTSNDGLSSRPRRERRQPELYGGPVPFTISESDDDDNDTDGYVANSSSKRHQANRQTSSSGHHARRSVRQRSSYGHEPTGSISTRHAPQDNHLAASTSEQPASASQQVTGSQLQAVRDWPDEASYDGEAQQVDVGHVNAEQIVNENEVAAVTGGSLSTVYDADGDLDEEAASVPAATSPLPPLSRSASADRAQQHPLVSHASALLSSSQALFAASAELAARDAAAALPAVPVLESVPLTGAATLPGIAVPSSIARPAPTPIPLSSPTQEIPSASAPQLPGTVAELVAAANADMGDEDAIALGQMQVFSRVEHLLNLENDKKHDPLDALVKFTGLTLYQAMEIRKQYLKRHNLCCHYGCSVL